MFLTYLIHQLPISDPGQYFLHFLVGGVLFAMFRRSKLLAFGIPFLAGISKEAFDFYSYGGWNWLDILFTVLVPLIFFLGLALNRFFISQFKT